MKKSLLIAALLASTAAIGLAQQRVLPTVPYALENRTTVEEAVQAIAKSRQRTVGTGVYYTRPEGTIYKGMNDQGVTLGITWLVVPPFYEPVFKNHATNPARCDWYLYTDMADDRFITEENDFTFGLTGAYNGSANYYLPTLSNEKGREYTLGENATYFGDYQSALSVDTIGNKSFFDPASISAGASAAWGKLDNSYALGSGTYTDNGKVWKSTGFAQIYGKPATPLYIEEFHALTYTSSKPLTGDARLTLQLMSVEQNANGEETIGKEVLGTFYATAASATQLGEPFNPGVEGAPQTAYTYMLSFENTTTNVFGDVVRVPAVINQRFALVVTGLDGEGVDADFPIVVENEEDRLNPKAYGILKNGDEETRLDYNAYITINISFWGGFNHVSVNDKLRLVNGDGDELTISDANVLRVSDDGLELKLEGTPEGVNINSAMALTAFDWYDADGNPNYYAELPDWVVSVDADESLRYAHYSDGQGGVYTDATGQEQILFECEPLPAGVEGRSAVIYLEGHGCKSSTPIVLLQGNATISGIDSPAVVHRTEVTRKPAYNLAGQRVGNGYKGFVIKNGKKYLKK